VRLRYFNACGADTDGEIGEDHSPETHLIPLVLDAALARRPSIAIFGQDYPTPDGTAIRDYIHVMDLASAHVEAIRHLIDGRASEAINLGTGRGVSVEEVIKAAERTVGHPIPRRREKRRDGDPSCLVAAPNKARDILGWQAVRSDLDTVLADAWVWHLARFGRAAADRNCSAIVGA
jgi:UDP-glucose 4-epimerase